MLLWKYKKFINSYIWFFFIVIFIWFLSYTYFNAAENISWMLRWDWWVHSVFAQQIIDKWNIVFEDPYRLFDGLKLFWELHNYPIHYTQYYHLSLWIYNSITWNLIFNPTYSFILNIFIWVFLYLIWIRLLKNKGVTIICVVLYFLLIADRALYINFMEPFLILQFLVFIYLFSLNKWSSFYIAFMFLWTFWITKHAWLFDSGFVMAIVILLWLANKSFSKTMIWLFIYWLIMIWPYYGQWSNIWTIWYWVWTFDMPTIFWIWDRVERNLFTSYFQMFPDRERIKLSYQVDKSILQYLSWISNYLTGYWWIDFYRPDINYLYILVILNWSYLFFKSNRDLFFILIWVYLFEIFLIVYLWQNLKQYFHLFNLYYVIILWFVLREVFFRYRWKSLLIIWIIFLISLLSYFDTYGIRNYWNVWRKTLANEIMYEKLWDYILKNNYDWKYLASDVQFWFYSKQNYLRYEDFWSDRFNEKKYNRLKNYFWIDYVVVSSNNFRQKWAYDYISENLVKDRVSWWYLTKIKQIDYGDNNITMYKLN